MLSLWKFVTTPEYLLRPSQVLQRLRRAGCSTPEIAEVTLPWGARLTVRTDENIGRELYFYGIFDKIVPEAISRLLDPGECALEIGANIGQNCTLMAVKVQREGKVFAFEPHPDIFKELEANCARSPNSAVIHLENVALSKTSGEGFLQEGADFGLNRGSASLGAGASSAGFKVQLRPLDEYLENIERVGVCKLDVEGHELEVLEGAERSLGRRAIRDLIFEDFGEQPSLVVKLLRQHGFEIFRLSESWWKPQLELLGGSERNAGLSFNFLATLEPTRAQKRFRNPSWHCLSKP